MSRGKNIRSRLASPSELLAVGDVCALPSAATSTGNARIHTSFFITTPERLLSELLLPELSAEFSVLNRHSTVNDYATPGISKAMISLHSSVARAEYCTPPAPKQGR